MTYNTKTFFQARVLFGLLALSAVLLAPMGFADEAGPGVMSMRWDVTGGATGGYTHVTSNGSGAHSFGLSGGAQYFVLPQVEAGLDGSWSDQSLSSGGSSALTNVEAVGTFDFDSDVMHSFFVTLGIGFQTTSGSGASSYTQLAWQGVVGKRFELVSHVAWAPFVGLTGVAPATDSTGFRHSSTVDVVVTPLQFSFLF